MLPFQTPDFDPSDPQMIRRVEAGPCMHVGFHMAAAAHLVEGAAWILLSTGGLVPGATLLAYPLPVEPCEDVHQALSRFQATWHREADRLGLVDAYQAAQEEKQRQAEAAKAAWLAAQPKPKRPVPKPYALEGAVLLPGLEAWALPPWEAQNLNRENPVKHKSEGPSKGA